MLSTNGFRVSASLAMSGMVGGGERIGQDQGGPSDWLVSEPMQPTEKLARLQEVKDRHARQVATLESWTA